jgi:hypothetical protein
MWEIENVLKNRDALKFVALINENITDMAI